MLTEEKIKELRSVLRQVNVTEICRGLRIRPASVWEALRGERDPEVLIPVVRIARQQIKAKLKQLESL